MSVFFTVLTFLFILVSVALVLVILVQRPQGGGLASAFGGGGGTDTAFGGRTGDALTVGTVSVFVVYLILAMALNIFNPQSTLVSAEAAAKSEAAKQIPSATMPAPAGSTAPATAIPVTQVTMPPVDGAAPSAAPVTATVPATPVPAPAAVDPSAPPASIPAANPAANPAVNPAKPQQL